MNKNPRLIIGGIVAAFLMGGAGFALGHWTGHMHGAEHSSKEQSHATASHSQGAGHSHGNEKAAAPDAVKGSSKY